MTTHDSSSMTSASHEPTHSPDSTSVRPDFLTGMQPAFCNQRTGEAHLSQTEDGLPAQEYRFVGLPEEWVVERDDEGMPTALHPDIVAGYWRDARFVALTQLNQMPLDA